MKPLVFFCFVFALCCINMSNNYVDLCNRSCLSGKPTKWMAC